MLAEFFWKLELLRLYIRKKKYHSRSIKRLNKLVLKTREFFWKRAELVIYCSKGKKVNIEKADFSSTDVAYFRFTPWRTRTVLFPDEVEDRDGTDKKLRSKTFKVLDIAGCIW